VRYQEPVEKIEMEIVYQVESTGNIPRDYVFKSLQNKEINYATATYHLLQKKQQLIQKLLSD
jgi:hypothetical protein